MTAASYHAKGGSTELALQVRGAEVDDWAERVDGTEHFFQLRRRKRQLWSAVRDAFEKQSRLKPAAALHFVVHLASAVTLLRRSRHRVPGVAIDLFPAWLSPREQILKEGPARAALLAACVLPSPAASDLEWIWKELGFAWENVRVPGRFCDIGRVVKALPDQDSSPLRVAWKPTPTWMSARKVLASISGLTFSIEDGTFFYSTSAGFRGRMSCRSSAFRRLVKQLLLHRPKSVSKFEGLL